MAATHKGIELAAQQNITFDPHKCIICQRNTNTTVTSTENGRLKISEAANVRKDIVLQRLNSAPDDFCYHMTNDCYKNYTLKKSLDKIKREKQVETEVSTEQPETGSIEPTRKKTRSSITPREEASKTGHTQKQKCVICSKTQHCGQRDKFRISESPRANKFLQATLHLLDDVYTKVADLEEETSVFGADLYYHKVCLESYLKKYERDLSKCEKVGKDSEKRTYYLEEIEQIKLLLDRGGGISLSEIRNSINERIGEDRITNKEVKLYLTEHFGDAIQFVSAEQRNEPLMVFSSKLSIEDVVKKLRSINSIKAAAQSIRQSLLDIDYALDDRFCDAEELKTFGY